MDTNLIQQATTQVGIGKPQPAPLSGIKLETFLPEQRKILELKYSAKPFSKLSETEQRAHSSALIFKINIITGWPIPEEINERNILAEQLQLYLLETWPMLNVEEIVYAIRSHATLIENWGKNMNLSLIGKALISYEAERKELSRMEETQRKPHETNLIAVKTDWSELGEIYYQDYLNNRFNLKIMPAEIYDACLKAGYVSEDAFEDWLQTAEAVLINELAFEASGPVSANERHDIEQKIESIKRGGHILVETLAKKLTIEFLYQEAKTQKRKTLF